MSEKINTQEADIRNTSGSNSDSDDEGDGFYTPPEDFKREAAIEKQEGLSEQTMKDAKKIAESLRELVEDGLINKGKQIVANDPDGADARKIAESLKELAEDGLINKPKQTVTNDPDGAGAKKIAESLEELVEDGLINKGKQTVSNDPDGAATENTEGFFKAFVEDEPANTARQKIINNLDEAMPTHKQNPSQKGMALLKERARALANRSQFFEACSLLEKVDEEEEIRDLGTNLLMADCYLQLGRERKAGKCLRYIENILTSAPHPSIDELEALADDFSRESANMRAMIILNILAGMILNSSEPPDEILSEARRYFKKQLDKVELLVKRSSGKHTVEIEMGLENALGIYEKIGAMQNCTLDKRAFEEAGCCRDLDVIYYHLHKNEKSIQFALRGIAIMEDHFTQHGARRYRLYSLLVEDFGVFLFNKRKYKEAIENYQKALAAREVALDDESEIKKKQNIERIKGKMQEAICEIPQ